MGSLYSLLLREAYLNIKMPFLVGQGHPPLESSAGSLKRRMERVTRKQKLLREAMEEVTMALFAEVFSLDMVAFSITGSLKMSRLTL